MGVHFVEKSTFYFRESSGTAKKLTECKSADSFIRCLMSGLAVFGLKFPSLLQFDDSQEEETVRHNLKTLYGINDTPCDTTMRTRLDEVDPRNLRPAFTSIFSLLQRGKVLEDYKWIMRNIVSVFAVSV